MEFHEHQHYSLTPYELRISERNLWSLLTKLYTDGSARSMEDPDGIITVIAEKDEVHYAGRKPGMIHPITEAFIARVREALEDVDATI